MGMAQKLRTTKRASFELSRKAGPGERCGVDAGIIFGRGVGLHRFLLFGIFLSFAKGCGFSCGAEGRPASFLGLEVCYDD